MKCYQSYLPYLITFILFTIILYAKINWGDMKHEDNSDAMKLKSFYSAFYKNVCWELFSESMTSNFPIECQMVASTWQISKYIRIINKYNSCNGILYMCSSSTWMLLRDLEPHNKYLIENIECVQRRFLKSIPAVWNHQYLIRIKFLGFPTLERRDALFLIYVSCAKFNMDLPKQIFWIAFGILIITWHVVVPPNREQNRCHILIYWSCSKNLEFASRGSSIACTF